MPRFVPNRNLDKELARNKTFQIAISEDTQEAVRRAKEFAPVDEGDYEDSIKVVVQGKEVFLTATDFKAHWIEWGTADTPVFAPLRRGVRAAGLTLRESR